MAGKTKTPIKTGRPTKYNPIVAERMFTELAEGISLRMILTADDMPAYPTVMRWLDMDEEFRDNYTRAKEKQADFYAEELVRVSYDTLIGKYDPAAARIFVDTIKWTASKLKPKKYGDKLDMTTNGKDLPTPILGKVTISDTVRDIIEGQTSNEVSQKADSVQKPNLLDDINA